jgi:signal transduction histidine kinase
MMILKTMHQWSKILKLWIVVVLCLYVGQGCTFKEAIAPPQRLPSALVVIDSSFTSQSLNEQVWVSTTLTEKDLSHPDLRTWFRDHREPFSQKKNAILLGNFRKYPQAWFYTQVINTTHSTQQLVVDEFNRIRCDDFEVLSVQGGRVKSWGRINRSTPFSEHPIPFFTYSVPFTIPPKDTLHLLVRSQRHYGAHEVNLSLATYQTYLSEHIFHFLSKVFQVIVFVVCALIMFVLGRMYRYKAMTYLGLLIISLIVSNLSVWGFSDALLTNSHLGLSGGNASTFTTLLVNTCCFLFNRELMKVIPKNEKVFDALTYAMMAISLLGVACYLLPKAVFDLVYTYIDLPLLLFISIVLTVSWSFFCSFWALIKAKIYYMLLGVGIALFPVALQQLPILSGSTSVLYQFNQPALIFYALGYSIISIYLLREQLISRRKHEATLKQAQESLEEIRKTEVEAIGRNLHDNVGNILVSAMGYLHLQQPKIELSNELLNEAINEIRFLSHNLVKDQDARLHAKLESLVSRFNDFSEVVFVFEDYSKGKLNELDTIMQQNIYMIVQEAFTNIIKHAKATEVFVQVFEREGNTLQIIVEDDGIGILNFTENKGIGLKNMEKRAAISKLTLTVDSGPSGTNFIIETPKLL